MSSSYGPTPTVMPNDTCLTVTVTQQCQITVRALGLDIEPVLALEKGTYIVPLRPSPLSGDRGKSLPHLSPEHPDSLGASPSDRPTKTLGEIELKITTSVASMITFDATPAPCLDLGPICCEYLSMVPGTIKVNLKPIRPNDYLCGRVLLPNQYHHSLDHPKTSRDQVSWTFTAEKAEGKELRASNSQCPGAGVRLPDLQVDVPGAGTYKFGVEDVLPHSVAAEDSTSDKIPETPFDAPAPTVFRSPAGSQESGSGGRGSVSDGFHSPGGRTSCEEPQASLYRKRGNDGCVGSKKSVSHKKVRK